MKFRFLLVYYTDSRIILVFYFIEMENGAIKMQWRLAWHWYNKTEKSQMGKKGVMSLLHSSFMSLPAAEAVTGNADTNPREIFFRRSQAIIL